jgi:hypothetical protein
MSTLAEIQALLDAERRQVEAELGIGRGPSALDAVAAKARRAAGAESARKRQATAARRVAAAATPKRTSGRLSGEKPRYSPGDLREDVLGARHLLAEKSGDSDGDSTVGGDDGTPLEGVPTFARTRASFGGGAAAAAAAGAVNFSKLPDGRLLEFKLAYPKLPGSGNDERWNTDARVAPLLPVCHWHRHKTADRKLGCGLCTAAPIGARTNLYCADCCRSRFNMNAFVALRHEGHFLCAFCRGDCNCGPCLKKLGQGPTGTQWDASQGAGQLVQAYLRGALGKTLLQDVPGWAGPAPGQHWIWELTPAQLAYVMVTVWRLGDDDFPEGKVEPAAAAGEGDAAAGSGEGLSSSSSSSASSSTSSSSAAAPPPPAAVVAGIPPRVLAAAAARVAASRAYYAALPQADKDELATRLVRLDFTLQAAKEEWDARLATSGPPLPPGYTADAIHAAMGPRTK